MGSRKFTPAYRLSLSLLLIGAVPAALASSLSELLAPSPEESRILPVEQAFSPQAAIWQNGRLSLAIDVAPGCYLYRDRFSVEAVDPAGYKLGKAELPEGQAHRDEHFGEVRILRDRLTARFKPTAQTPPKQIRIRYQGCAEGLVCYPPQTRILDVEIIR